MRFLITMVLFFFSLIEVHASQVVLVTGASRGIGLAIANHLASNAYIVYAGVRTTSSLQLLSSVQEHFPKRCFIIALDVTDQESVDKAIQAIIAREGRIDVLVNNAGIMSYGSVENVTIEEAQRMFDVNFFGAMRVTQAVLPTMRAQKQGRIIQISSRSGFRPLPSLSVYAATKFALEGLSETMAATLKPWNIHVSLIEPGPVNTDLDYQAPYGSRLSQDADPYEPLFRHAGLLDPFSPFTQQPEEIALIVQQAIEADQPLFRYQTTPAIQRQAAQRRVDITGLADVQEWDEVFECNR